MDKRQVQQVLGSQDFAILPLPGCKRATYLWFIKPSGQRARLPADEYSMNLYLSKGFKVDSDQSNYVPQPSTGKVKLQFDTSGETTEEFKCETCGKVCSNPTNLGLHKKKHKNKIKNKR